ncbi:MAG: VWA domain-containing protein [bacterium]
MLSAPVLAQTDCVAEVEPNDTPDQSADATGALCLKGTIAVGDQELYRLHTDGPAMWTMTLTGVAGNETRLDLMPMSGDPPTPESRIFTEVAGMPPPALLLPAGDWLLGISTAGEGQGDWTLALARQPVGPTDAPAPLGVDAAFIGLLSPSTTLDLPLTISQVLSKRHLTLTLDTVPGTTLVVALDGPGGRIMERNVLADGPMILPSLGLDAGDYILSLVSYSAAPVPLRVMLTPDRPRLPTREDEPNDLTASARMLMPGKPVTGELNGDGDQDRYRFSVTPTLASHLLSVSLKPPSTLDPVAGAKLDASQAGYSQRLCLLDAAGTELQCQNDKTIDLTDLGLPEGDYLVQVTGPGVPPLPYEVALRPGPDRAAGQEAEPNDTIPQAQPIQPGETILGRYPGLDDDRFALDVTGPPQLWKIVADGGQNMRLEDPQGTEITARDQKDGSGNKLVIDDILLTAGRHTIRLEGVDGSYALTVTAKGPPPAGQESEPNDFDTQANILIPGAPRVGTLADGGDRDILRFHLDRDASVALTVTQTSGPPITFAMTGPSGDSTGEMTGPQQSFPEDFKAGDYILRLRSHASDPAGWRVSLDWAEPPADPSGPLLTLAAAAVASHLPLAQAVTGTLRLNSASGGEASLAADSPAPGIYVDPAKVMVSAGQTDVPVTLLLPLDLRRDADLPIAVTVTLPDGTGAVARARLAVTSDAPALGAYQDVPVPPSLRGGFDLASPDFNGHVPDDAAAALELSDPTTLPLLFNGIADTAPFQVAAGKLLRLDFGPADPVMVAGFALMPRSVLTDYAPSPLQDFQIALSGDGQTFTPVVTARLGARDGETFFALSEPVPAKAATINFTAGTMGPDAPVLLSEFKVIAAPGQPPGISLNLADPDRGGQVVRVDPQPNMIPLDQDEMLKAGGDSPVISGAGPPALVIGFADTRRAIITSIDWVETPAAAGLGTAWGPVRAAAAETPLGPWTDLGTLTPDAAGAAHLDLTPVVARFVRFTAANPPAGASNGWIFPTEVRVQEQAGTAEMPSILGEWGMGGTLSGADLSAPTLPPSDEDAADNDSADAPGTLNWGQQVAGRVTLAQDEDWWRFTAPAGVDRALITLSGQPFVTAAVTITGPNMAEQPLRLVPPEPGRRRFEVTVTPGADYLIHVTEPPRSLVVAFDVSGSLASYWQAIRAAMGAFAEAPVPGRDFIRFLAFEGQFQDPDWTDQPDVIRRALTDLSAAQTGSGLETTVITAVSELQKRDGLRALLVLTDGATSSFADRSKMWAALDRSGIDVMAAHIGGWDDPRRERQILQEVAAVGGGFFADVAGQGQIDMLAERAVDWIRRPARYGLIVETSTLPPPEPAKLSIVHAATGGGAPAEADAVTRDEPPPAVAAHRPAVELIIDASGSMLQQLGGEGRRIDVAHKVLDDLIRQKIPADTPVALRAFGDDAAGSCETSLRAPLSPLSPDYLAPIATGIEPVNLAKTPIAASLAATTDDLSTADGPRVVVLVTDGEETCGGNPAAEIATLRASGVQVTVNIVGFAVDDSAVAALLEQWAKDGGGRYLPASDGVGLGQALSDAILESFTVSDASGNVVAEGQVGGEPVDLASGTYKVSVGGGRVSFDAVTLNEGEARVLDLTGE